MRIGISSRGGISASTGCIGSLVIAMFALGAIAVYLFYATIAVAVALLVAGIIGLVRRRRARP